jgi:glycerol-3-phosphate acyltransferase PlsY
MITKIIVYLFITAIAAYFTGGLNGAIIASKTIFRKDIRNFGSGNAGLTNFTRTFGARGVVIVLAVDILKAIVAVSFGGWLMGLEGYASLGRLFAGFCTMLGHVYPVYYRLKGGKAALCGGTVMWMVDWRMALICWSVFIIVVVFTKYVSLGSILASTCIPLGLLIFGYGWLEVVIGLLCMLLVIIAHRENVVRLISGTESKLAIGGSGNSN